LGGGLDFGWYLRMLFKDSGDFARRLSERLKRTKKEEREREREEGDSRESSQSFGSWEPH